jgi:histidinol-phosphatase (PHP family)
MNTSSPTIDTLSDRHVHTRLCNHATGEMEEYVQAAIALGLREIVFLEHLEIGIKYSERTWLSKADFDYYFEESDRLRRTYADRIRIGSGVEVGYNGDCEAELIEHLAARPWDSVGISCHFLKMTDRGLHLNLLSRRPDNIIIARQFGLERLLTLYFDALITAVKNLPGTFLCHLDAALRHVPELVFTDSHFEQIDTLLAEVKKKGMALELNTSGIAMRNEIFPARKILSMALGYDLPLQAGSDAHRPEDVGRFFETLPEYITSAVCL